MQGHNSRALEPQVSLEVLSDFADEALKGELANQQLSGLLVPEVIMLSLNSSGGGEARNFSPHLLISLRATVPGL